MNDFDFYVIKAHSRSIRSLMKINMIERKNISTRIHRGGRFPIREHSVSLAHVDVMHIGHKEASRVADNIVASMKRRWDIPSDVKIHVEFHARD